MPPPINTFMYIRMERRRKTVPLSNISNYLERPNASTRATTEQVPFFFELSLRARHLNKHGAEKFGDVHMV